MVCVNEFADRYGLHMKDAYAYLQRYKGIGFLHEFYDVEHTLSFDDVIDDLSEICRKMVEQYFEKWPLSDQSIFDVAEVLLKNVQMYENKE